MPLNQYPVRELADYGPLDLDALVAVEQGFLSAGDAVLEQSVVFEAGLKETRYIDGNPDTDAFRVLGSAIMDAVPQNLTSRLGKSVLELNVRQSVTDSWDWHMDDISTAIAASSVASPVGLRGTLPVEGYMAQFWHIKRLSAQNDDRPNTDNPESQFGKTEVVSFGAGRMIGIKPSTIHSRPVLSEPGIIVPRPAIWAVFTLEPIKHSY